MFIVAYCIMGVGSVPLYSLGPTYIDDVVRRDKAAIYLGKMELKARNTSMTEQ